MHGVTHNDKGFSLIEVMTSLALGLVVVMLVIQLFINAKNNHAQNERVSETLESGRYALRQLTSDLKEAGFLAGVTDPSKVTNDATLPAPANPDCGAAGVAWAFDWTNYHALEFDYDTANTNNHTCIPAANLYIPPAAPANDILAIKRVAATPLTTNPTAPAVLTNGTVYLRSDYSNACLWYFTAAQPNPAGASCPAAGTSVNDWQYIVHVYYIANQLDPQTGQNVPTFCRAYLQGTSMQTICLAPGVERFHVMFGVDIDGDGVANEYIPSAAITQHDLNRAVSARVYVLARALQPDSKLNNSKQYQMGDVVVNKNDNYYRRLYSTTVMLRNPMSNIKYQ